MPNCKLQWVASVVCKQDIFLSQILMSGIWHSSSRNNFNNFDHDLALSRGSKPSPPRWEGWVRLPYFSVLVCFWLAVFACWGKKTNWLCLHMQYSIHPHTHTLLQIGTHLIFNFSPVSKKFWARMPRKSVCIWIRGFCWPSLILLWAIILNL